MKLGTRPRCLQHHRVSAPAGRPRNTDQYRYYSTKGKDHLLLIPLTSLRANFDGTEKKLKQGQAYTSDATEVEVNADLAEARWVVVRVETPE
jgi:hypothetical protein